MNNPAQPTRFLPGAPWSGRDLRAAAPTVTAALFLLGLLFVQIAAWQQYWTYDEPRHFEWSNRLVAQRVTERQSKATFNSKTPITLLNVNSLAAAEDLVGVFGRRLTGQGRRAAARLPGILWFLVLVVGTYQLARRVASRQAAAVAAGAVALDPNVVAHSSLVTVDAAFAAATLLCLAAAYAFARKPGLVCAGALGLAYGLAFVTKFSAVLLIPALVLLPLAVESRPERGWLRWAARVLLGLAVAAALSCVVVSVFYLFVGFAEPFSELPLRSHLFQSVAEALPGLRLPLPRDFITGVDLVLNDERNVSWAVYLFGRIHPDGVWYYFPVVWSLKTPLLVIGMAAGGVGYTVLSGRLFRSSLARFLAANILVLLLYFMLVFRTQLGLRYVLMCIPLAYVVAAPAWERLLEAPVSRPLLALTAASLLVAQLTYLGNPLAYTNVLIWPKRTVWRVLADSNVKWGQNEDKVDAWLERIGEDSGIINPPVLQKGLNAVGINQLVGIFGDPDRYRWLRENAESSGHFRHSYILFDVDEETFQRYLHDERALEPNPFVDVACPDDLALEPVDPGRTVPVEAERGYTLVCIRAPVETHVRFDGRNGDGNVSAFTGYGCRMQSIRENQAFSFLIPPGTSAFCLYGREPFALDVRIDGSAELDVRHSEAAPVITRQRRRRRLPSPRSGETGGSSP